MIIVSKLRSELRKTVFEKVKIRKCKAMSKGGFGSDIFRLSTTVQLKAARSSQQGAVLITMPSLLDSTTKRN